VSSWELGASSKPIPPYRARHRERYGKIAEGLGLVEYNSNPDYETLIVRVLALASQVRVQELSYVILCI
jgi:hypothetical protein